MMSWNIREEMKGPLHGEVECSYCGKKVKKRKIRRHVREEHQEERTKKKQEVEDMFDENGMLKSGGRENG